MALDQSAVPKTIALMVLAITSYQWFLAFHILVVVLWVGSGFCVMYLATQLFKTDDAHATSALMKQVEGMGLKVFAPTGLLTVILGFILVGKGDWHWKFWLIFALAGWVAAYAHGAGVLGRKAAKLGPMLESEGWTDGSRREFNSYLMHIRADALLLVLIVLDMTLKPGL